MCTSGSSLGGRLRALVGCLGALSGRLGEFLRCVGAIWGQCRRVGDISGAGEAVRPIDQTPL